MRVVYMEVGEGVEDGNTKEVRVRITGSEGVALGMARTAESDLVGAGGVLPSTVGFTASDGPWAR